MPLNSGPKSNFMQGLQAKPSRINWLFRLFQLSWQFLR